MWPVIINPKTGRFWENTVCLFLYYRLGNRLNLCSKVKGIGLMPDFSRHLLSDSSLTYYIGIKKKILLLRCIHHFKSDLINDMDHMRISGTEPSSVILSQRK